MAHQSVRDKEFKVLAFWPRGQRLSVSPHLKPVSGEKHSDLNIVAMYLIEVVIVVGV